jgi:adenine-specific DNA-methyltransferase
MTDNYKSVLENILKKDKRLVDDSGELNGNLIHEYASSLDEGLIDLLLNEEATREKFFLKVKDVYVFKQNDFKFFLDENKIDNSYTQYANRIGLSTGGKFLKDIDDVVLDFPYKDCVLEGGQSTEEGTDTYFEYDENEQDYIEKEAKRKEIFFNQILAKDEIDRLTEPKAFNNIKRYTEKGEEKITSFNRDAKGQITDNLIIKGNNLLALHALKEQFQGKIKLIYIDPPYNTGGDSFAYNDNFNHSAWLVFMRNRLEQAYELLAPDGVIFIQIDYLEHAYLKVLADTVFGKNQALPPVSIKTATPAGFKVINPGLVNVTESILIYAKGNKKQALKKGYVKAEYQSDYNKVIINKNESCSKWNIKPISEIVLEKMGFKNKKELDKKYDRKIATQLLNSAIAEYSIENSECVFATYGPHKPSKRLREGIEISKNSPESIIEVENDNGGFHYLLNGRLLAFYSSKLQELDGEKMPTQRLTDFWNDLSWDSLSNEGGVTLKNGKKPESLVKRIIELATNESDIVMDYHLGSGTTAAVAHKLKRQYIGIEQLDYGDNDSTIRLKNVINGDKSGISNIVNWNGGGSFVYCELAKNNQKAIDKIMSCNSLEELIALFDEFYEKYFLNYNVKVRDFKEKIVKEKEFQKLTLDRQKEIFARMLDLNQLYVNVSDMEDSRFKLSDEDISLTKNFYQL